jgi:hypothetical protein
MSAVIEFGLGSLPGLNSERIILFAAPLRNNRPVEMVTCVVLEKLPEEGKALGYATVLPKWHPLLSGMVLQAIDDEELATFFPAAESRVQEYYHNLRKKTFDPNPVDQTLSTSLNLV